MQDPQRDKDPSVELEALERLEVTGRNAVEKTMDVVHRLSELDAPTVKGRFKALLMTPVTAVRDALNIFDTIPQRNFALAKEMIAGGHTYDAVMRLKIVLWFAPKHQMAHYLLGATYLSMGKQAQAVAALQQSLRLDPAHEESAYVLATIDDALLPSHVRPTRMPHALVHDYFDNIALEYDVSQQSQGYAAHIYADEFLRRYIDVSRVNYRVLDLGCGTGLMGGLVRDVAMSITGVDFSRAMTQMAMQRFTQDDGLVYERVLLRDLREYLQGIETPQYDIVTMVHVANYLGECADVFKGVAGALRDGGVWLLQVEYPEKNAPYGVVKQTGRFGHSEAYVREQAALHGLVVVAREDFRAYPDQLMQQFIVRKGDANTADADA